MNRIIPQAVLILMLMVFPTFSFLHSEAKINPEDYDSEAFLRNIFSYDYEHFDIVNIEKDIDDALRYAKRVSGFNGSVIVAHENQLLYSGHIGYADYSEGTDITDNSAFQLASVSKQFTAAAILQLAERNLLSLDDTITHYLPELDYDQITIRQMLNHTSGLAIYFWLAEHKWEEDHAPSNEEVIDLLAKYEMPQFFRSGARFDYSNTGYVLLASIVERVSGLSFAEYLEQNIFDPLNMDGAFVYRFQQDSIRETQLNGYRRYGRKRRYVIPGTVNDATVGDKNIYMPAKDLYRWITALNNGLIVSDSTLNQMYSRQKTRYGRSVPYGFGFRLSNYRGENMVYHDGKWNGFRTSLRQFDDGLIIIMLEHTSYSYPSSMVNKLKNIARSHRYALEDPA